MFVVSLPALLFSAADVIYDNVDVDANIIFGALIDDKITNGEVRLSIIWHFFFLFDINAEHLHTSAQSMRFPNKIEILGGVEYACFPSLLFYFFVYQYYIIPVSQSYFSLFPLLCPHPRRCPSRCWPLGSPLTSSPAAAAAATPTGTPTALAPLPAVPVPEPVPV